MVTSRLLEAFLACPVKCHMLSKQELPEGTEYSTRAIGREHSYRLNGRKLDGTEIGSALLESSIFKNWSAVMLAVAKGLLCRALQFTNRSVSPGVALLF